MFERNKIFLLVCANDINKFRVERGLYMIFKIYLTTGEPENIKRSKP
ncbi:MAG: hypothetical protein AVDCRST_MAG74-3381 [uncultured Pyrinomonadaceae bacterium]|uniref:Uncharacterized protein n=1 Tax=uncultured Pyrinomonadaceae bacterium TaxID=2283094 RepID=A0A6J4PWR3_9BACT|nr:MAG: hypothetical protein AVDCRST_MAG74-3381 [uncultured Pyrinomonadaceae bacterium]